MTSNGKQVTVIREMLTAVARDQRWYDVVAGISARFSKFSFVSFCYITNHSMTDSLRYSEFCFPRISMPNNSLFHSGLVIKCLKMRSFSCRVKTIFFTGGEGGALYFFHNICHYIVNRHTAATKDFLNFESLSRSTIK